MTDRKTLGNASLLYICPTCGCPDLMGEQSSIVVSAKLRKVMCPNCKWEGSLADAAGVATTEKVYDTKTILNLLLFVVTKHAAGPIAQALTFVGLLEADDQAGIDKVMRAATEGVIEKAFMAAAEHAAEKSQGQFTKLGDSPVTIVGIDPAIGPDFTVETTMKDGAVVSQTVIERKDPEEAT